jgi:hypothetical protein
MGTTATSPLRAIRAFCIECSGNNKAEVRRCPCEKCQLFPFRMGHRPKGCKDIPDGENIEETEDFPEVQPGDSEEAVDA